MKNKKKQDMEEEDLKKFYVFFTLTAFIIDLFMNIGIMEQNKVFYKIAPIILVITIMSYLFIIIKNLTSKNAESKMYLTLLVIFNLTSLLLYLGLADYWQPKHTITKILIFANFFIIEGFLLYRRIIIKDKAYMDSIKFSSNGKYSISDIKVSVAISITVMIIAKIFDSNEMLFYNQEFRNYILALIGVILPPIGIVASVTAIATYMYSEK